MTGLFPRVSRRRNRAPFRRAQRPIGQRPNGPRPVKEFTYPYASPLDELRAADKASEPAVVRTRLFRFRCADAGGSRPAGTSPGRTHEPGGRRRWRRWWRSSPRLDVKRDGER